VPEQRPSLHRKLLPCANEFAASVWGPVVTGALTQRGLFTRELESFGRLFWGPVATVGVGFGPQSFSRETENLRLETKAA